MGTEWSQGSLVDKSSRKRMLDQETGNVRAGKDRTKHRVYTVGMVVTGVLCSLDGRRSVLGGVDADAVSRLV